MRVAFNMILSFQLFFRTLAALNFVRASHSSPPTKNQNSFISPFIRSRAFNTTVQHVRLDLANTNSIVQTCTTDNSTVTVQDCSCSTQNKAAQAINDAITMVQAVQGVWNDEANLSIRQLFMGTESCENEETVVIIDSEFPRQRCMYTLNEDQNYWHT